MHKDIHQQQLAALQQKVLDASLPLKDTATNLVFGKGNPDAQILFIGEAPGKNEDLQGIPFVGRAGQELDGFLKTIGRTLDDVYIANILKYRPPKNRAPQMEEIRAHTPFLVEQILIIKPRVIVTLGNFASKFVLAGCNPDGMKRIAGITEIHGKPHTVDFNHWKGQVIPMYHPAAMLYNPRLRAVLTEDFARLKNVLDGAIDEKSDARFDGNI